MFFLCKETNMQDGSNFWYFQANIKYNLNENKPLPETKEAERDDEPVCFKINCLLGRGLGHLGRDE